MNARQRIGSAVIETCVGYGMLRGEVIALTGMDMSLLIQSMIDN